MTDIDRVCAILSPLEKAKIEREFCKWFREFPDAVAPDVLRRMSDENSLRYDVEGYAAEYSSGGKDAPSFLPHVVRVASLLTDSFDEMYDKADEMMAELCGKNDGR